MPTHPEELAFAKRILAGEEEAIQQFVRKYRSRIILIASKRGVPYQDCPDIAQETFLAVFRQLDSFKGNSLISTWIQPIILARIADYWRRIALEKRLPHPAPDVPVSEDDRLAVREALSRLPGDLRAILVLSRIEEVTLEAISRGSGLTLNQVSKRLYKAEKIFCDLLKRGATTRKRIPKRASSAEEQNDE